MCKYLVAPFSWLTMLLELFTPLVNIGIRLWLFWTFTWTSGFNKLNDWSSTLSLFENIYDVPYLRSDVAAYLATAGEILLPSLLLLGVFSRFSAVGLFILNITALYAYSDLWQNGSVTPAGSLHIYWGALIAVICVYGPGKISIDYLLNKKCSNYAY